MEHIFLEYGVGSRVKYYYHRTDGCNLRFETHEGIPRTGLLEITTTRSSSAMHASQVLYRTRVFPIPGILPCQWLQYLHVCTSLNGRRIALWPNYLSAKG